tara:strand:+ start:1073 stop:2482 length:1410 start_codon:yes stop_codon:yes gene_type:complete
MALDRLSNITRSGLGSVHTYDVGGVISTGVITATSFSGAGTTFATFTNGLRVTSGLVGIGTDAPAHALDIQGSSGSFTKLALSNQTMNTSKYEIIFGDQGQVNHVVAANREITFATNGGSNERLRITSDGKIGIGTDNPDHKLRVDYTDDADGFVINNTTRGGKFRFATSGSNAENFDFKRYDSVNDTYRRFLLFGPQQFSVHTGFTTTSTERLRVNQVGCLQIGEPSGTPTEVMQIRKASSDTEIITYANTGYKSIFNCTGSNRFALERGGQSIFEIQDPSGSGVRSDLRFDGNIILNHNIGETNNSAVQAYRLIGCSNVSLASGMAIVGNQTDTMSTKAARITTSNNNGTAFFGPYGGIHPGSYTAMFHMKVSNNSNTSTIIRIDVFGTGITDASGYGDHRPRVLNLAPSHFDNADRYMYVGLDFNAVNSIGSNVLEVRGINFNNSRGADLYLDHILIVPRIPSHDA